MSEKPLPIEKWSLWKLILFPLVIIGIWAALPIFYPYYSPGVLIIGILLTTLGIVGIVMVGRGRRRWGHIAFYNAFFLLLFTFGARAWLLIIGKVWLWLLWMTILFAFYILAWALPTLNPKISALLWREQYTPETRFGKAILSISAKIIPIAGSGGALIMMYGSRSGYNDLPALLIGIIGSIVSIGFAQVAAHQFWREDRLREQQTVESE